MEIHNFTIQRKSRKEDENFVVIPIGDIHLGCAGCNQAVLRETIKEIENNKNYYWVGMGDYIEAVNPNDKRFDPYSIDPSYNIKDLSSLITTQIEDIKSYFRPIKDKCLGLLCGNHEETIRKYYYRDIVLEMAHEFKVKYMGYAGFIQLRFVAPNTGKYKPTSRVFEIFAHHGYGGGRTSGPKVNKLEGLAKKYDVDLVLFAHVHQKIIAPPIVRIGVNQTRTKLVQKTTHAVTTGSFKKAYVLGGTTYEERFNYGPSDLGTIKITIYPGNAKDIRTVIEMS